jgi:predicted enzyme related to lactoylglutathione lyase
MFEGRQIVFAQLVVTRGTGGRVLFFLYSDDFEADYARFRSAGIEFPEGPSEEDYGKVAVFKDLYGNRIDLIEPRPDDHVRSGN